MNLSTPPNGMMDPTAIALSDIDTLFKPMETDLFQELYLSMTTPGLMTPMDDWQSLDLLDNNNSMANESSIQDLFLTSPSSINDAMLTPSSSPEVLFNSLIDIPTSSSPSSPNDFITTTISHQETKLNDTVKNKNNKNKNNTNKVVTLTSPLEMMLTLDTPLKTSSSSSTKISKDKSKKKVTPPAASLPVTSHIMSASTPTFTLKQTNGNGNSKKRTYSSTLSASLSPSSLSTSITTPCITTSTSTNTNSKVISTPLLSSSSSSDISTELALKRQRNTDAARRSRLRKVQKMESLSSRVSELETIHQQLLIRLATLETDKSILLKNEATYQSRIEQLESELTEAHVKLAQL